MVQAGRGQRVRYQRGIPNNAHPLIYESTTSCSTANQCFQLAAEYSADIGDLGKAIELYEQVGDWSLSSPLTKYSVKEYWLRAALCSMAMGVSFQGCV